MGLIDVIYDLATGQNEPTPGQYTVTRTPAATYGLDGYAIPGTPSTLLITACVQPQTGRDLRVRAEAQVTLETRQIWTDTKLYARTPQFEPDQVTIDGETWTVHNVKRWEVDDETFYVVLLTRDLTSAQPDASGD